MAVVRARVVLVTTPDAEVARALVRTLVEERHAACGNIVPAVVSIFRWRDALHEENEVLVVLKTTEDRFEAMRSRIVELHPYEVPEILALDVGRGHEPYLEWLAACVGPDGSDDGT